MSFLQSSSNGNFNPDGELLTNETDNILNAVGDYSGPQTNTVLITGIANSQIEIHNIYISSSTNTGSVVLTEETSGTIIFRYYLTGLSGTTSGIIHKDIATGKNLLITCPANTFINVSYHIDWFKF